MTQALTEPKQPHYRMTLSAAKQAYKQGLITATGLLYYAVKTTRKDGHKLRVKEIENFCTDLGIKRATYYKSLSKLRVQGLMEWAVIGEMDLWVVPGGNVAHLNQGTLPETDSEQDDSTNVESQSTNVESQSTNVESQSTNVESQSTNVDEKSSNPLTDKDSSILSVISSDLDQSFSQLNKEPLKEKEIESEQDLGSAGINSVPDAPPASLQEIPQTSLEPNDLSLGKSSGAATTKKNEKLDLLRSLYNEYKPPLWASCHRLNNNRINTLKKVYEDCGDAAPQMLKDALLFVTSEEWWSTKVLSLDNLLTKGKVVELAEKWQAKCASPVVRQGDSHVTQNPASQVWGEWVREAEKRRLVEFSQSAGSDIMVHLKGGTSRLWSELRSLSWDALTDLTNLASGGGSK